MRSSSSLKECLRSQTAHSQLLPLFGGEIELPLAIKGFLGFVWEKGR